MPIQEREWPWEAHDDTGESGWGYSKAAVGEQLSLGRYLPLAWRIVADPGGGHLPPTFEEAGREFYSSHAYWIPLVHLCRYALGWPQPELGLTRWLMRGRPVESPVLATIDRWYGDRVVEFAAWGFDPHSAADVLRQQVAHALPGISMSRQPLPRGAPDAVAHGRFEGWTGGGDNHHLQSHASAPLHLQCKYETVGMGGRQRHAALLSESYFGWYRTLHHVGLSVPLSVRKLVDIVVRPLGWMGTYQCSPRSGIWHSGERQWHQMGLPEESPAEAQTSIERISSLSEIIKAYDPLFSEIRAEDLAQVLDNDFEKFRASGACDEDAFLVTLPKVIGRNLKDAHRPSKGPLRDDLIRHVTKVYW